MKRFVDFLGKLVAGILVTAFIFAAAIFFFRDSFVLSSYSPPNEPQMYFATEPNAEDQYVLVKLNPDSSLELIRVLTDKESYYADTVIHYEIRGQKIHSLFGNVYLKQFVIPFANIVILLPYLGKKDVQAFDVEFNCVFSDAFNAKRTASAGDKYRDLIYFSDNVFYLGNLELSRIYEWPEEIIASR